MEPKKEVCPPKDCSKTDGLFLSLQGYIPKPTCFIICEGSSKSAKVFLGFGTNVSFKGAPVSKTKARVCV